MRLGHFRLTVAILNKSSAVAEMGDRSHNRHGPKKGAAVPLSQGSWVPILHNVVWAEAYLHTKCCLDPSVRLATMDMG